MNYSGTEYGMKEITWKIKNEASHKNLALYKEIAKGLGGLLLRSIKMLDK